MSLALAVRKAALAPGKWVSFPSALWRRAKAAPSLDLRFADNKSLVDAVTGQSLVTFTRASSGTYVGSDGLIKTATTNLLLRSEEFDNASWSKTNCSITANAVTAPNGALAADKIVENTAATIGHYVGPSPAYTATAGLTITYSVYAKAAERTFVQLVHTGIGVAGGNVIAGFDLTNGTAGTPTSGATSSIIPVGDGWYRCSLIYTPATTASTLAQIRIALNSAANPSSYTGDGTSGIYIWGAQLEQSPTVGEYIPTTSTINSAPRFDHNPTTGESLGLLVEESRTNLLVRSEGFDDASWLLTNATVSANTISAPNGSLTADKFIETVGNGVHAITQGTVSTGITYVFSVYAKAGERTRMQLSGMGAEGQGFLTDYNLSTGVVSSAPSGSQMVAMGNGWYRCTLVITASATGGPIIRIRDASGNNSYTGDGTSGIYIWGAQLEAGAFPTSYTPSTTATVTRSADVASITGANFSSWYRQDEGTLFAEATSNHLHGGTNQFPRIVSLSDGTTATRIDLVYRVLSTYTDAGYSVVDSNVSQASFDTNRQSNGTRLSVGYQINNFAFAQAGSILSGATDNSGTVPVVNQLSIGRRSGTDLLLTGTIRRLAFWPQRLSNSTLQAVTQ